MSLKPVMMQERAHKGVTHFVDISHTDLTQTTADTAQAIQILAAPRGTLVEVVGTWLMEAFEDTADAAFNTTTLEIGDAADADRLLVSQETNVKGTEVYAKAGTGAYAYDGATATAVNATFSAMAAKNLAALKTGKVRIYLRIVDLTKPGDRD